MRSIQIPDSIAVLPVGALLTDLPAGAQSGLPPGDIES